MKFQPGRLVCTRGVWELMQRDGSFMHFVHRSIGRHLNTDWGIVCQEDKEANGKALKFGSRLVSAYGKDFPKIWIITEADRSATTVLFPDEY